jgi:5-methylcytosine-specific restriction endonuclease McrA
MRIYLLFDKRCAYCDEKIVGLPDPDHVIPLAKGGHNTIGNILPACRTCNCDKRDLIVDEWNADRRRRGLPPRHTTWSINDPRYRHLTVYRGTDAA